MSDEEDKYIKQKEADQLASQRRERQLEALRREEREGIAQVLSSSDAVAAEALELGFDRETARILPLVPVIQVAWADGSVSDPERDKVLEMARNRGVDEANPAYDFLDLLLEQKPSELFFERTNRVIAHMVSEHGGEAESLLELCKTVAEASGGFFGLTKSTGKEEAKLIEELARLFEAEEKPASSVIVVDKP